MDFLAQAIGFVRSPFVEKTQAPRQGATPEGAAGRIEILSEHEHALADLAGFDRIWILFWFHEAATRDVKKVLPPRSEVKRGVFATRSPHRPNPIGMTAARLEKIDGLVVHVRDLDILDGTPVLDLKPYIAYADAFPDARAGWLDAPDPKASWEIRWSALADEQAAFIGGDLESRVEQTLALGPQPHPYRRIKKTETGLVLAVKAWRVRFALEERTIAIASIASGYRPRDLAAGTTPEHELHRAFGLRFPEREKE